MAGESANEIRFSPDAWSPRRLASLIVWLTVAGLSVDLVALLAGTAMRFPIAGDVGYPDSALLVRLTGLLSRGELFPPLDRPPYLVTVYGPLTYLVLSVPYAVAEVLGVSPVRTLRVAEIVLFGACVLLIGRLAWQFTRSGTLVLVAVLFALSGEPLRPWILQLRGDFLGLLLSLSCIALCLRGSTRKALWLAAVLAGLAILSKQTFIAAPAAVIAWLTGQRQYRTAALWAAAAGGVVLAGYAITFVREPSVLSHGAALRSPILEYRVAGGFLVTALMHLKALYGIAGAVVLLRGADTRARLVVTYWAFSWLVAVVTIPQVGANMNYFWEPWFVSSLLAAVAAGAMLDQAARIPATMALILILLHLRALTGGVLAAGKELRHFSADAARVHRRDQGLLAIGQAVHGYTVLSTSPYIARLSSVPVLPDPFLTSALVQTGTWNPAPVLASLRNGEFDVVIGYNVDDTIGYRRLSNWHPLRSETGRHPYRVICTLHGQSVWLKPASPALLRRRLGAAGC